VCTGLDAPPPAQAALPPVSVMFSSAKQHAMLPALDRATRGPNYTPELVPETFTDNWRRTGWGSESARYYYEHIRPYLGNLWPSSQPRARAFQVRCLVRTSFPPRKYPNSIAFSQQTDDDVAPSPSHPAAPSLPHRHEVDLPHGGGHQRPRRERAATCVLLARPSPISQGDHGPPGDPLPEL
jgi:hypothetical protein